MTLLEKLKQQKIGFGRESRNIHRFEQRLQKDLIFINNASIKVQKLDVNNLLFRLEKALQLNAPSLNEYIIKLIPIIINSGQGILFTQLLEKAIQHFLQNGMNPTELFLAKVKYLGLVQLESKDRYSILMAAVPYARTTKDHLKIAMAKAIYHTDVSNYKAATKHFQICLKTPNLQDKDLAKIHNGMGINYFYMFKMERAKFHFLQAGHHLKQQMDNRIMAANLHYLGRLFLFKGQLKEAMNYYVEGLAYQLKCPEELEAIAFWHIRMGELLVSQNILEAAKDHLEKSQAIIKQIKSDGAIQTVQDITTASFYQQNGQKRIAKTTLINAIAYAEQKGFSRGVLLCYVRLFWLDLTQLHLWSALKNFTKAMVTFKKGELRRNIGLPLISKYIFQLIRRSMAFLKSGVEHTLVVGASNEKILSCTCPYHEKAQ
ncbi:MAG: hypothetical protein AAF960_14515 [Bacteroidota bacterium]